MYAILQGDCIEVLSAFPDEYFDSVVTDPPYALSFMGKSWDTYTPERYQKWCEEWARECLRVLKPGGHMLAFGGTRTYHRLACAIEDAGFEIRDSLHWIYGSGFPKSRDISKAIDSEAGAEREVIGHRPRAYADSDCWGIPNKSGMTPKTGQDVWGSKCGGISEVGGTMPITAPATDAAKQWQGWGTALKPAHEPIVMARKPLAPKHTVAANVLEFGTGAINVDGCRVESDGSHKRPFQPTNNDRDVYGRQAGFQPANAEGRWPPNILLSEDAAEEMDRQSGNLKSPKPYEYRGKKEKIGDRTAYSAGLGYDIDHSGEYGDTGGASRFFPCFRYQAKASRKERPQIDGTPSHPTVKPVALMRWLVKLCTPPGGVVLDPFAGTGTTAQACEAEDFDSVSIEKDPDNIKLFNERMSRHE